MGFVFWIFYARDPAFYRDRRRQFEIEPHVFASFAYSGGLLWVITFVSLGYFLGEQWSHITDQVNGVLLWVTIGVVVAGLAAWWLRSRKRDQA